VSGFTPVRRASAVRPTSAWTWSRSGREADGFGRAEHAALAWCEALTLLPASGAPDELFDELSRHFTSEQLVALTLAIVAINGWNRLNVGFRTPVAGASRVDHARAV
jgi:alkylhydroperoxidase family enzyme